jgi:energy-coupling factor transporter transmembrane protein EcfT
MGELTTIGFHPGRSLLHRLDPRTKQALLMGVSVVSVWGQLPFLLIWSITLFAFFRATNLKILQLIREIRYFLFLLVLVFVMRAVSLDDRWMPGISLRAATEGLLVCWRLLLVVLLGILLMATTRIAHIRAALVWFMTPIPWVDEKMSATMVGLVVRFLPVILFQASEISDAQRARGIERRKNPFARLMKFSIPLFRRVFLSADELTAAMQARCYNEQRTLPDLNFARHDGLALVTGVLLCLTVLIP